MKRIILSVFTICTLGSWPVIANAQSNNGQNNATSINISGGENIKQVKPKVEAGLNGEYRVTTPVSSSPGKDNILVKKAAEAQRKAAMEKLKGAPKPSNGQSGSTNVSTSGQGSQGNN